MDQRKFQEWITWIMGFVLTAIMFQLGSFAVPWFGIAAIVCVFCAVCVFAWGLNYIWNHRK